MRLDPENLLTKPERARVEKFLIAARALPRCLVIETEDFDQEDLAQPNLIVRKRVAPGYHVPVGGIRKKSLT